MSNIALEILRDLLLVAEVLEIFISYLTFRFSQTHGDLRYALYSALGKCTVLYGDRFRIAFALALSKRFVRGKKMSSRQSALHSPAVIVHIENMRDRGKTRRGLISAVACEVIAVYMYSGAETDVEKGGGGVTP